MKRKMALTWQLFVVPFVTIMVRWLSALSITAEPPTPGQLCSLRRELRCCGNKVRGSMLASQDWLLAWDEGKEDCIVATAAANRVRESLGNPAMFSITKITWENQQPTSLLIFHLETSVFLWIQRAESAKALPHATAHQEAPSCKLAPWREVLLLQGCPEE